MRAQPQATGACCPKGAPGVAQLRLHDDGRTVGIIGLAALFEALQAERKAPDAVDEEEWLRLVRGQGNYVPRDVDIEKLYAAALRRAYEEHIGRSV